MRGEAANCKLVREGIRGRPEPDTGGPSRARERGGGGGSAGYALFSRAHIEALIASANGAPDFKREESDPNLTTSLTLRMEEADGAWTVYFNDGAVTRLEATDQGEFAISGKREWWEAVFRGRIDPFLATQQGKLKLERGELWKLSQWFKPFQRAFALWQTIPVK